MTICTQNKASYFDQKPELKQVIIKHWKELPHRYPYITLDEFVVMPNHVHGIICITENVGVIHELPLQDRLRRKMILPKIIGYFKMNTSKRINQILNRPGNPFWQRNYYEHIIRNEDELMRVRRYIQENPLRWEYDKENPMGKPDKKEIEFWREM